MNDYNRLAYLNLLKEGRSLVTLYVTSLEKGTGKTAVCAGLGKHLLNDGKKIGFFKPIIAGGKPAEGVDSDAEFIKQVFALKESVESLCPVFTDEGNLTSKIKEAFTRISKGKDVVIVEGIDEQSQVSYGILEALDARVIIVEGELQGMPRKKLTTAAKYYGKYLLGVVLNKVPGSQAERVRSEAAASFSKAGVSLLGVLPEDRALLALTISELAEHIQGEILNNHEKSAELAENFMLGAMCIDPGPVYFGRKANKVAVLRSERADMQLAALETSTRCLVLSGDTAPNPSVLYRAEDKKIPVILTKDDVSSIVTNIEDALAKTRFNQENKLPKLTEIMEQNFDFQTVYKGLGLAG